ncbi:hypothetical protein LTS18_014072, partial [Coniosporium uncinatum]
MEWITKNLTYKDKTGAETIEEQGLVTIDMIHRAAYSDRDETYWHDTFASPADGEVSKKRWIVGMSILTIETAGRSGLSQITHRRPTITRYSTCRPQLASPPRHQVPVTTGLAADAFYTSSYVGILPEDIFQEWYAPQRLAAALGGIPVEQPTLLPEDDMMQRFLSTFDRNSTVDGHKVGVIYIGENQTDEKDILSNVMGSSDYTAFVGGMGKLTKLKGATFNTQGLDKEFDSDGEFTYCWRDRCTELVLHVTTMMPTNLEDDPHCTKKKSHIGNDFVNIVWNNSGRPFKFDTFPSAFNYLYIVITPQARASFVETRHNPNQTAPDQYYRVQVLSQEGFPELSPAAETKI